MQCDDMTKAAAERLAPFLGEWSMEAIAPWAEPGNDAARMTFEWMPGGPFLIQRWEVPIEAAPDGLAVIGWDEGRGTYLQHYFDSRGVARVYEMTFEDGVWTLERSKPDFSDFDFSQRFTARFSEDGKTIEGTWEMAEDHETYETDFGVIYRKVSA